MVKPKAIDGCLDAELLKTEQAAALLQMDPVTLANWRMEKKGPPYLKLGGLVRYPKHLLVKWAMESLVVPGDGERVA